MEYAKHTFENYWNAYSDDAEAKQTAKRRWTQATISRGIVPEAVRVLAASLFPNAEFRLEEARGNVLCIGAPLLWRDLRVEFLGLSDPSLRPECLSELLDRSREALCLCVLPSSSVNTSGSVSQEMPWTTGMYFYPDDIDALGRGACTVEELIEYKFYRVHALEKPVQEAQYDERLLADFRSALRGQPNALVDVMELLKSYPDDPRRWAAHPLADRLIRTLDSGRSCLVIGSSSSGKTVLALETAQICANRGRRTRYLNLGSIPGAIPICLLDVVSNSAGKDSIIFLDDLQSNPQAAKYFGNIINLARRASVAIAPRLVGISWPDFAEVAAQFIEDALPVYVRAKDVRQGIISAYSSSGELRGEQEAIDVIKEDLQLLRIYLEVQEDFKNRAPTLKEVAAAYWSRKTKGAQAQSEDSIRVALTVSALGRYDVLVPQSFVERESQVSSEVIASLRRTGLLRLTRGFLTVGHRSLAALICDWLASVDGWTSMTTLNGPGNPLGVAQDFLRTAPPSVALETLRALQARAGFKQTDKLNSRTAALVSTWRAFNALLERIEHQQVLDPQWGGILSSIMFAVQSLAEVGRTREARDSIQFLRSKYRLEPSGSLRVEVGSLKTTKDFELIAEAMQEFDAAYGDTPLPLGWPRAGEIDIERFHRTWLSGVVLCTEAAFREVPDVELSRIAEAVAREQLPTGAFYPERAVWSTARVCLGLAACGRSIHTDRVLKKAIDWLLTPGERGGARDAGIWRSGTGRWNTDLEVTSMAVLACLASGVQSDDERLRPAMRFLISQRDHWITPGSELDGALAAQAYLEAGGAWDEISGQVRKLSEWAQGEAFWHTATLTSTESLEQSCRVAQTASHLLSIGWSALRADLPVLLHALEMPERPVTEAITSQRTPQEHDLIKPNSPLASPPPETSEYTLVASVEKISSLKIEDLSVVNNYCRFDPKTRNQLNSPWCKS